MIEKMLGEYAGVIMKMFRFIIGEPHKALLFSYLLMVLNMIIQSVKARKFGWRKFSEKTTAYTTFIILGNILDHLLINNLTGWSGPTQFMVCLHIVAKEMLAVKDFIVKRYGYDMPILTNRLEHLERVTSGETEADLNTRIDTLRQELKKLEEDKQKDSMINEKPEEENV
jgi:hypothetical protein